MAARPRAPVAGPGVWSWLGLWLPAGGALGCLAGPAERQSASLGALGSAWVEAWVRVKSITGPAAAGVKYSPTSPKAPRVCLLKCEGPGALCFAPQKRNAQYKSP